MANLLGRQRKIYRAQKKVLLTFLGIPMGQVPDKASELDEMIEMFKNADADKFERALTLIADCELPPEPTEEEKGFREVGLLVRDYLDPLKDQHDEMLKSKTGQFEKLFASEIQKFDDKIAKLCIELASSIKGEADEAIKTAAEKYHRIEVKIADADASPVEGLVHEKFEHILQLAANRVNILLVGPAGCGKTHIASQIAQALGIDYSSQSCSAGMSESQLTGWLLPIGDSSQFTYVSSEFVRIYENGGAFLLDEMDASDANVLIFINQALANEGFHLPQRYNKPYVKKHPNFVAIAAANTFGGGADSVYHGRNALDAATLDRFKIGTVEMDYCPKVEESIIDPEVLWWGRIVRGFIKEKSLERIMSTRVLKDSTKMKKAGWDLSKITQSYFADWSKEEMAMYERFAKEKEMKKEIQQEQFDGESAFKRAMGAMPSGKRNTPKPKGSEMEEFLKEVRRAERSGW